MSRLTTAGPTAKKRAEMLRRNLEIIPEGPMRGRLSARLAVLEAEANANVPAIEETSPNEVHYDAAEVVRQYDLGWQDGWDDAVAYVKGELVKPPEDREIWLPTCRPATLLRRRGAA